MDEMIESLIRKLTESGNATEGERLNYLLYALQCTFAKAETAIDTTHKAMEIRRCAHEE